MTQQPIPEYEKQVPTKQRQWAESHKVKSSDGKRTYVVSRHQDGSWACSCPVWKYRRKQCKHITAIALQRMRDASEKMP